MNRAGALPLLVLTLLVAACGDADRSYEVEDVRTYRGKAERVPIGTTSAERFGYTRAEPPAKPTFTWTTPDGWKTWAGSDMRAASWRVEGEPETDCSFTLLPGRAGDALSNINRWRRQMGVAPVTAEEVAKLPRAKLLDRDALYVNIVGRYDGGMGGAPIEEGRLLGLLLELPSGGLFLKFVGPAGVVAAQQGAFEELATSIKMASPGGTKDEGTPRRAWPPKMQWTLPSTWEQRAERRGRVVTAGPKGAANVECYIYPLVGDGGGLDLNVNRWRRQMAQEPLNEAQIRELERVTVLGKPAVLVKVDGSFDGGMGGEGVETAQLFGLVSANDGWLLTVKMTGPAKAMASEWDNFRAFCASLRD